jgi:hypothetical protein
VQLDHQRAFGGFFAASEVVAASVAYCARESKSDAISSLQKGSPLRIFRHFRETQHNFFSFIRFSLRRAILLPCEAQKLIEYADVPAKVSELRKLH